MVRFVENIGTAGDDYVVGSRGTVSYGLRGSDFLTSQPGSAFSILIGGGGNDSYASRADTVVTIADLGGPEGYDVLTTQTLGPSSNAGTAVIDSRHFLAVDRESGERILILDFLSPDSYIEEIRTPDGTFSTIDLYRFAIQQDGFVGNVRWEDLTELGFFHPYSTAETNEAIDFYTQRAVAQEIELPVGDAGSVYRFFNEDTGTHFYTTSVAERDAVFENLFQYRYEGEAFDAASAGADDTIDVYRFFNKSNGTHFYTANAGEANALRAGNSGYQYEGAAYRAYDEDGAGREALYRFYDTRTGSHFYTASEAERDQVDASLPQFRYEGVAYYVDIA